MLLPVDNGRILDTRISNKDDCKRNHFKKKSNKAMHNDQSSPSSAGHLSGRRSQSHSRSPSHSYVNSSEYMHHMMT